MKKSTLYLFKPDHHPFKLVRWKNQRPTKPSKELIDVCRKHGIIASVIACKCTAYSKKEQVILIDGENRKAIALRYGLPFEVKVIGETVATHERMVEIVSSLQNSKSWNLEQFVNAFVDYKSDYKTLKELHKSYGISYGTLAAMLNGDRVISTNGGQQVSKFVKEGTFKITTFDEAMETIEVMKELPRMKARMISALFKTMHGPGVFHVEKFKKWFCKNYSLLISESEADYYKLFKEFSK